jgi:uncharacterized membrane protein YdjX (TVP38/TMEM64 family)
MVLIARIKRRLGTLSSSPKRLLLRLALVLLVLAGIIVAAGHRSELNAASIEAWLIGYGWAAPLIFIALYVLVAAVFIPATLVTLAGGMLFGPLFGALYSLIGASLSATLMMLLARYVAGDWAASWTQRWLRRVIDGVNEEGWRFVFLMRLIPGIPFAPLNYAFGLTRIRLGSFLLATVAGMLPAAIVINYVGYAGREAALGGGQIAEKALYALGGLAVLALLARLFMRLRRRSG